MALPQRSKGRALKDRVRRHRRVGSEHRRVVLIAQKSTSNRNVVERVRKGAPHIEGVAPRNLRGRVGKLRAVVTVT